MHMQTGGDITSGQQDISLGIAMFSHVCALQIRCWQVSVYLLIIFLLAD